MQFTDLRPVFICGHHRSGTTLLVSLLDGHSELLVAPNELHFFKTFLPRAHELSVPEKKVFAREFLLHVLNPENVYYRLFLSHVSCELAIETFDQVLPEIPRPSDYLDAAVFAYGKASGQLRPAVQWWVEKTPQNERHHNYIFSWWEQAKCIHMIRDPRDVYTSFKRRSLERNRRLPTVAGIAQRWKESATLALENVRRYGAERYIRVRYEDLVLEPAQEMKRICSALNIQEDAILYQPTKGGGTVDWKGNSLKKDFSGISPKGVGRWKEHLEKEEIAQLEVLLGPTMREHGYTLETDPSVWSHLKAVPASLELGARQMRAAWQMWKYRQRHNYPDQPLAR